MGCTVLYLIYVRNFITYTAMCGNDQQVEILIGNPRQLELISKFFNERQILSNLLGRRVRIVDQTAMGERHNQGIHRFQSVTEESVGIDGSHLNIITSGYSQNHICAVLSPKSGTIVCLYRDHLQRHAQVDLTLD